MEAIKQQMSMFINILEERLHKSDNVTQGTHECVHVELLSINKHVLGGFYSYSEDNHGQFPKGIHLLKIDMRKYLDKDPITWIF